MIQKTLKILIPLLGLLLAGCAVTSQEEVVRVEHGTQSTTPRPIKDDVPDIPPKPWEACGDKITPDLREHLLTNDEPYFMIKVTFEKEITDKKIENLETLGILVATHSANTATARASEVSVTELCQQKDTKSISLFNRLEGVR